LTWRPADFGGLGDFDAASSAGSRFFERPARLVLANSAAGRASVGPTARTLGAVACNRWQAELCRAFQPDDRQMLPSAEELNVKLHLRAGFSANQCPRFRARRSPRPSRTRLVARPPIRQPQVEVDLALTVNAVAPGVSISAASGSIVEGASYTLGLSVSEPAGGSVSGWTINWGDGTTSTILGNPQSATHLYTRPIPPAQRRPTRSRPA